MLLTFRCDRWPLCDCDVITRQPDHRRMYLDYQGPISGDRGEVARIASGLCRIRNQAARQLTVALSSSGQDQNITLQMVDDTTWRVSVNNLQEK
jgi:hypothetical protein